MDIALLIEYFYKNMKNQRQEITSADLPCIHELWAIVDTLISWLEGAFHFVDPLWTESRGHHLNPLINGW